MTIADPGRARCGKYDPGTGVYLAGVPMSPPCTVISTAIGVSRDASRVSVVCLVQTREVAGGASFWMAEDGLVGLDVSVLAARDASDAVDDGALAVEAVGGTAPYRYRLTQVDGDDDVANGECFGCLTSADVAEFGGLCVGTYSIDVEDVHGIRASRRVSIYGAECRDRATDLQVGTECVACCAAPRSAVILPCRHMGLCMACARSAMQASRRPGAPSGVCPFCRGLVCETIGAILA
jgi:hypothetical protein